MPALGDRVADVALDGRAAGQCFQAAVAAAAAQRAARLQPHVTDFGRRAAVPQHQLAVEDDAAADAGADENPHRAVGKRRGAEPLLAQGPQVHVVSQGHGQIEFALQPRPHVEAAEIQVGRDHDLALPGR